MKQSEAVRIPMLLAARLPRPVVEEAVIEGIRMTVIIGDEVDTVIRYTRGGGADMPQLSTYPEVAESAANADERVAKQRASGRMNTTPIGPATGSSRKRKLSERYDMKVAKTKLTLIHRELFRLSRRLR